MKRFKNEDGAITIITVVTVLLVASFLISSLMIVSNRVKTQKEMIKETREIYEPKSSMQEIYNSFFNQGNVIPIYNVEQLIKVGSGEKINIDGKIYKFENEQNTTYLLKNDIEFKISDYENEYEELNDNWIPFMERKDFKGTFDYNGKKVIIERKNGVRAFYPVEYAKELEGLGDGVSLVPYSDLDNNIRKGIAERKVQAVLEEEIDENKVIAVIPTGFTVSSIQGENTISGGLVVRDSDENEFVWIPVPNISDMALPQEEGSSNYRGVIYNWASDSTGQTQYSWDSTSTKHREPANLTDTIEINGESVAYDSQETFAYYGGGTWTNTMYQTEFNSMVQSVAKYKGFYIGRYETGGFNTNKIVVKAGETVTTSSNSTDNSINYVNWYKAYQMQKDFASNNANVASTMIWGCQWDQVMKFVDEKEDGAGNIYDVTTASSARHTGELATTGSNINDKVQNIYDLDGNVSEWTLEATYTSYRPARGNDYYSNNGDYIPDVTVRFNRHPTMAYGGSRATLYIR